ncbi:hypothetical protein ACLOJK_018969 [Asimina triloba]
MATITASLERSLAKFSLRDPISPPRRGYRRRHHDSINGSDASAVAAAAAFTTNVELDSDISLPYQWEQCLDLKVTQNAQQIQLHSLTGEIYYIDWRSGTKLKEDPRKARRDIEDLYSYVDSSDESEEGSSTSSREEEDDDEDDEDEEEEENDDDGKEEQHVLVVAGCKSCLMYFMLPKTVDQCPKCTATLLHFSSSQNGYL